MATRVRSGTSPGQKPVGTYGRGARTHMEGRPERDEYGIADELPGASELKAWIASKARKALNRGESEESNRRVDIYDRYLGQAYGDEEDGYSKLVTRECFQTVLWTRPELMRVFFSSSRLVDFVPFGKEDIEAAQQESDVVNYMLRHRPGAYEPWSHWVVDFLLYMTAYLKIWWDDAQRWDQATYRGVTPIQIAMLRQRGFEILHAQESGFDSQMVVPTYDVRTAMLNPYKSGLRIECVPPEEVLVDNLHTMTSLDTSRFVCHYREIERTDLIAMGFDRDLVENLQTSRALSWSTERVNRRRFETEQSWSSESRDDGTDTIEVYETYANYDYDNDGYAEKRYIFVAGDTILINEETDYQPMCAATANPLPHRHLGLSSIEMSENVQHRNTVLERISHDSLYRTVRGRVFAPPGTNIDQLMNYEPHGVVEYDGQNAPTPEVLPVHIDKVLPMLERNDTELGKNTGVTPGATVLDPNVLAKSTMGAYLAALEKNSGPFEMMVRDWAEIGVKSAAMKVRQLLRQHQDTPITLQLRNQWIDVDPSNWAHRYDMRPCVGLGTGDRNQRVSEALMMGDIQEKAAQVGLTTPSRMYRTLSDLADALGKPAPDLYFVDPNSPEGQQIAQQRAQEQQQQQSLQFETMRSQIQVAMADIQARNEREMAKLAQDFQKFLEEERRQWATLELKHAIDVPGEGIGSETMQ